MDILPHVLKTADVARYFLVSAKTVDEWRNTGKLPFFRTPGGSPRFHRKAVLAFAKKRSQP